MPSEKYIGIEYPFKLDNRGNYFSLTKISKDAVRSNLYFLLRTQKGERLYQPDFGFDLQKFLFEPLDEQTIEILKNEISDTIKKNIKGLAINNILVETGNSNHLVSFTINFEYNESIFKQEDQIQIFI